MGFEHRTSSPGHQQANGQAKSAVKTAKNILRKAKESKCDPYLAILAIRNTPTEGTDSSPAQRLLGRRTKRQLPTTAELLKPQGVNTDDVKIRIKTRQQRQAHYYDKKPRDLSPLKEGDVVHMRPFALNGKTWEKASRDLMSILTKLKLKMQPTGETKLIFERHKKRTKKILRDMKSTQGMIAENLNPHISQALHHLSSIRNLMPHNSQP